MTLVKRSFIFLVLFGEIIGTTCQNIAIPEGWTKEPFCPWPFSDPNGQFIGRSYSGSKTAFYCDDGYTYSGGDNKFDCQADGTWSNTAILTCVDVDECIGEIGDPMAYMDEYYSEGYMDMTYDKTQRSSFSSYAYWFWYSWVQDEFNNESWLVDWMEDLYVCSHGCVNTVGSFQCTCPPPYTLQDDGQTCGYCHDHPDQCLELAAENKRYEVHAGGEETKWLEANDICTIGGGVLAMPKTQYVDDEIRQFIIDNNLDDQVAAGFWIGLQDRDNEGTYVWSDATELGAGYSNWYKPPNNKTKKDPNGQDCIQLWKKKGLKWDDAYCGDNSNRAKDNKGFICEMPL